MRLSGKTALVTGAARGLGRAIAHAYAAEGADVVLVDICGDIDAVPYPLGTESQLEHTAALCRAAGARVLTSRTDVRDLHGIEVTVAEALDRFGSLDILVNNAGVACPSGKPVHEISEPEWSLMLDIDLSGAWRAIRAAAPHMLARRAGSIINVSSTAGTTGYRNFAAYVAAKHGLVGLTRAAALDLAPFRVRVNALCPGSVRDDDAVEGRMLSEIARSLGVPVDEHEQTFVQAQPMNTLIEPKDVSGAALWLASDESCQVTGSVVSVDGGFTAR